MKLAVIFMGLPVHKIYHRKYHQRVFPSQMMQYNEFYNNHVRGPTSPALLYALDDLLLRCMVVIMITLLRYPNFEHHHRTTVGTSSLSLPPRPVMLFCTQARAPSAPLPSPGRAWCRSPAGGGGVRVLRGGGSGRWVLLDTEH